MIYLDNAATTRTAPEVVEAMLPYFGELYGNPSAIYSLGSTGKKAIGEARRTIAGAIGAKQEESYFTPGGTEADNWAIEAAAEGCTGKGKHIVTTKIEHHAVLHTCAYLEKRGYEVTYLEVDGDGLVDPQALEAAIRPDTILISVMFANNEIGTIEPIREFGRRGACGPARRMSRASWASPPLSAGPWGSWRRRPKRKGSYGIT